MCRATAKTTTAWTSTATFPTASSTPWMIPPGTSQKRRLSCTLATTHRFVMGANFHGGARVVNYPWDAVTAGGPLPPNPTPSPDDALFHDFSVGYAIRNPLYLRC